MKHYVEGHPNNLTHQIANPAQSVIPNFRVERGLLRLPRPSWKERDRRWPPTETDKRRGMVIDQNRCIGCWTCAVGCKEINNEPLGFFWNRILTAAPSETTGENPSPRPTRRATRSTCRTARSRTSRWPICPSRASTARRAVRQGLPGQATFRRDDGTVLVDYERCIGCRYCMAACPYGIRVFNWGGRSSRSLHGWLRQGLPHHGRAARLHAGAAARRRREVHVLRRADRRRRAAVLRRRLPHRRACVRRPERPGTARSRSSSTRAGRRSSCPISARIRASSICPVEAVRGDAVMAPQRHSHSRAACRPPRGASRAGCDRRARPCSCCGAFAAWIYQLTRGLQRHRHARRRALGPLHLHASRSSSACRPAA